MNKDDEYIDRVLSGETNAFKYFIQTYKQMAFNLALSIIKDDHYAEEIVQDAFVNAFNGLKSFNRSSKFRSWFYRIVVNESFRKLKKLKKDQSLFEFTDVVDLNKERISEPEEERSAQIVYLMKKLHPNESLALNLFYLEEHSLKEIADITGWSLSNTKVILHRARKNIRLLLGEK